MKTIDDIFKNMPSRAEMKANGEEARLMADESDEVVAGSAYTVSRSFFNGDRSWIEEFWHVMAVAGSNALVRIESRERNGFEPKWFRIDERAWYNADEAWKIVQENKK